MLIMWRAFRPLSESVFSNERVVRRLLSRKGDLKMVLICSPARQCTMHHAAVYTRALERGSSSKVDQVKKQAAVDGAHMDSFNRLRQVINKTVDVTNRKVVKLSDVFCKLQSER